MHTPLGEHPARETGTKQHGLEQIVRLISLKKEENCTWWYTHHAPTFSSFPFGLRITNDEFYSLFMHRRKPEVGKQTLRLKRNPAPCVSQERDLVRYRTPK